MRCSHFDEKQKQIEQNEDDFSMNSRPCKLLLERYSNERGLQPFGDLWDK